MSSTVLRCCCRRCAGGVFYSRPTDFLEAHRFEEGEYVLESEVSILASRDRHPSNDPEISVATFPDGSQILVETWPSGRSTAATRRDKWSTWGPPAELEDEA